MLSRLRSLSLEQGLRVIFIGLVTSNLIIVGIITIVLSRHAQWHRTQELQEERALALAMEVRTRLDDLKQQLSYLQKVRGLAQLPSETQRTLLESLTRENNAYEMVAIVTPEGQLLAAIAPYINTDIEYFASKRIRDPELFKAIKQQIRYIDAIEIEPSLKMPITTLVLPIQDPDGRPDGVLVATINLDFLNSVVARSQISETGYVYILDQHNQIIARKRTDVETDQDAILEVLDTRIASAVFQDNLTDSTHIYQGLRGLDVLGTRSLIYGVNWQVVVELPLQEVYAPIRRLMAAIFTILTVSILATIILSVQVARLLVSPLEKLTHAANQISQGQFSSDLSIQSFNEWQVLANAFNYMTHRIHESFQAIESKNEQLTDTLDELKSTQLQLVQNEKMSSIGQLVAGIAHEINNPIGFIYGNLTHANSYAQDLLNLVSLYQTYYPEPDHAIQDELDNIDIDFIKEDFPRLLASIHMGSQRVKDIVLSLRNFSRLDEAQHKSVDLHEGLENTLVILQSKFKSKPTHPGIKISKNYGELPSINCYPAQLNQVFLNLIVNAIDALEDKRKIDTSYSPEIKITTGYQDEVNPPQVRIRITDNAGGIPDDVKTRIFDPFFTTKPIGKGTGLGLSISYKIITETHCGQINCTSEIGTGTTFEIIIPAQIDAINGSDEDS
ncbi:MAG: sensor histidine kinase [Spirulina sp. SIO3F2]|nr:sensor histidine kinase [Spirulina sp. SIO3F2]